MEQDDLLRRVVDVLEEIEIDRDYIEHWVRKLGFTESWHAVLDRLR